MGGVILLCMPALQIRPLHHGDRERLREAFEHLSAESRYRRFLGPVRHLSKRELDFLVDVDHHRHEALVAVDRATGRGVGIARYVRLDSEPEVAEIAVTVADAWQGRGVGTQLVAELARRARAEGIARFRALVLADNRRMLDLLAELGPLDYGPVSGGTAEVEVAVPATQTLPSLAAFAS